MNDDIRIVDGPSKSIHDHVVLNCIDISCLDHESVRAHRASLLFTHRLAKIGPKEVFLGYITRSAFTGYRVNDSSIRLLVATMVFILILLIFLNITPSSIISG